MIRTALVGLGKMGLSHAAIINAHPGIEVVAVCDSFGTLLSGLNKYMGFKTYRDFGELLQNEKLDAVLIATPSRFHATMVRQALEKNLHVFCEKPFCLDVDEGRSLAELAERKGLVNQVGYHYRFLGTFTEAQRLLKANLIGKVHHVRAEAYGPVVLRPSGSTWRSSQVEGGGCLYDYACHAIDLINFLHGSPTSVEGSVLHSIFSADVDDEVYTTFRFAEGASGQLAANWSDESFRKMSMEITLWGAKGRIRIDRQELQIFLNDTTGFPEFQRGWNTKYTTELTAPVDFYLRGEEYSMQIDHFVRCINGEQTSLSSFRSALETDIVVSKIIEDAAQIASSAEPPNEEESMKLPKRAQKKGLTASLRKLVNRSSL